MVWKTASARPATDEVEPAEAKRRQETGAILIDVREPAEWAAGHAPGARHIPLGFLAFYLEQIPREGEVFFICRSGNRSGLATAMARRAGVDRARNVRGGMIAWTRAGLPVVR